MASYKIFIQPSAAKELESIGLKKQRERLVQRIRALASNPRPHGSQKLSAEQDLIRIRVGTYRVLYQVDDASAEVHIIKVGHRGEVYRSR